MNDRYSPILPKGYEVPAGESNFFNKFPVGNTRFRMLSPVTLGWRYWNLENRPVYSRDKWAVQPPDAKVDEENPWAPQHFWVFVAWIYDLESIQVMQVTQKKIMKGIESLLDNEKWGDSRTFDLIVERVGTSMNDTDYRVLPGPPTPIAVDIIAALKDVSVQLDNIFTPDQHILTVGPGAGTAALEAALPPTADQQRIANGEPTAEELARPASSEEEVNVNDIPF